MENSISDVFSPLAKDYCIYFYYLSVLGFASFIFILISTVGIMITKKKGWDFVFHMVFLSLVNFMFYFQNRLLYSMCVKSLV